MPDYQHVGINSDTIASYSGTIHCVSRTIPEGPLTKWIGDGVCNSGTCDAPQYGYTGTDSQIPCPGPSGCVNARTAPTVRAPQPVVEAEAEPGPVRDSAAVRQLVASAIQRAWTTAIAAAITRKFVWAAAPRAAAPRAAAPRGEIMDVPRV